MKLNYYIKENKKIYTLKESINNIPTKPAHYKFIKLKSPEGKFKTRSFD